MFNNIANILPQTKQWRLALVGLLAFAFCLLFSSTSHAAFNAGNIISNGVFTNHNSMNASQIQQFLNNKNSVCLKNTNTKYQSLVDDNGDGVVADGGAEGYGRHAPMTAAQLINAAAKIYKINPQVILVTLQKEQGLITRTDCPSWRYNTALGYGCPDSAPCDNSAFGFTRQIDWGTYHFRGFFNDSLTFVPFRTGNHYIQYNPSGSCGGTTVNIKNMATASLYSYTPYQPNAATRAAAPGQTVNCGAYGNINFWRFFTSWFGSTQGNRWTPLLDPRVLVTSQPTQKINPDTGATVQSVAAGIEIAFPTKTSLNDGSGCLRTRIDTINNRNSCIRHSSLSEFTPLIESIESSGNPVIKQTSQWTCKVNYRTTNATNQCFNKSTKITFLKKTTIAGVDYLITKLDADNNKTTAFRADRITDVPIITTLSGVNKRQKNTVWTCKVNVLTGTAIGSQCYHKDTIVNFSKKAVTSKGEYLITTHDDTRNINSGFLLTRFTPTD